MIAGGRRLAALKLLLKKRKLPVDYPVSCLILEKNGIADVVEVSLAENVMRVPVHPADQYDAFAQLQKEGLPVEDIAARFGIKASIVKRRLKLAQVSPKLLAAFRSGELQLEQLMAFAITDDHDAQEQVWDELKGREPSAQSIRHHLTRSHVEGSDRRAIYERLQGSKL